MKSLLLNKPAKKILASSHFETHSDLFLKHFYVNYVKFSCDHLRPWNWHRFFLENAIRKRLTRYWHYVNTWKLSQIERLFSSIFDEISTWLEQPDNSALTSSNITWPMRKTRGFQIYTCKLQAFLNQWKIDSIFNF